VRTAEDAVNARREQLVLLQDLTKAGIDPNLFDLLISRELDRNLKKQFGMLFFQATLFFTALSYLVIVLDGVNKWAISDVAITALIVETPLQFIGILYIIARNLFPNSGTSAGGGADSIARPAIAKPQERPVATMGAPPP
jgi:hypothetical protein